MTHRSLALGSVDGLGREVGTRGLVVERHEELNLTGPEAVGVVLVDLRERSASIRSSFDRLGQVCKQINQLKSDFRFELI